MFLIFFILFLFLNIYLPTHLAFRLRPVFCGNLTPLFLKIIATNFIITKEISIFIIIVD